MAEGLARARYGDSVRIQSAGSRPASVSPYTIEVMREIGIDISGHRSKSVDEIDLSKVDLVITLCAEEVCPIVPGKVKKLHWGFPDPADAAPEEVLVQFRAARDGIRAKIEALEL